MIQLIKRKQRWMPSRTKSSKDIDNSFNTHRNNKKYWSIYSGTTFVNEVGENIKLKTLSYERAEVKRDEKQSWN